MSRACHGPCQQGRLPCPTPEACEVDEPNFYGREHWPEMGLDLGLAVVLVMAVIAAVVAVAKFMGWLV